MRGIAFYSAIIVTTLALAQNPGTQTLKMGGWSSSSSYNQLYNPSKETTLSGTIVGISNVKPTPSMSAATRVLLKTNGRKTVAVDLGPSWFIDHQHQKLHDGDRVTVTGSPANVDNKSIVIARKIIKGKHVLYVRELTGFPMWVAMRDHLDGSGPGGYALNLAGTGNPNEAESPVGPVAVAKMPPPETTEQTNSSTAATTTAPTTMSGTLERVVNVPNSQTGENEELLVVNTPNGPVTVDVGPQWYMQQQPIVWSPGGNIGFSGYPYTNAPFTVIPTTGMNQIILANGLNWGNQFMILRNGPFAAYNAWY